MPGILPWGQKCELGSLSLYKMLILSQKTVMKIMNSKGLAREAKKEGILASFGDQEDF